MVHILVIIAVQYNYCVLVIQFRLQSELYCFVFLQFRDVLLHLDEQCEHVIPNSLLTFDLLDNIGATNGKSIDKRNMCLKHTHPLTYVRDLENIFFNIGENSKYISLFLTLFGLASHFLMLKQIKPKAAKRRDKLKEDEIKERTTL